MEAAIVLARQRNKSQFIICLKFMEITKWSLQMRQKRENFFEYYQENKFIFKKKNKLFF